MSFLDRVRDAVLGPAVRGASMAIASPWVERPTHLEPIVLADLWPEGYAPNVISRDAAIRIPAVARSRGLVATTIARLPIVARDAAGNEIDAPAWLTTTAGTLPAYHRMLWTVDDLFFHGWSLWAVERDRAGSITDAARVDWDRWHIDDDGAVRVDDIIARDGDVVLIPGINEGLLVTGADTLAQAARLARAADRAAETPAAQVELHQTSDAPMTNEDIDAIIDRWARARRGENGGVAYTTAALEVREHGAAAEHLLLDGRNASDVDIARHAGIPATMIDATLSGSSLSYQNTAARLSELVTFGLSPFMAAIASRLSQDDVTDPGVTIEFDATGTIEQLAPTTRDDRDPRAGYPTMRDMPTTEEDIQ